MLKLEFIIHPSGLVYLACAATPDSRITWIPSLNHLNTAALRVRDRTAEDYVATYNHQTGKVTKLHVRGLPDPRGLNLHGMDVVTDKHDPDHLWMYLVNHRPPLDPSIDAHQFGADSVVEVFKTKLGSNSIEWVRTFADPSIIVTPNDIVGGADGKEFWFTNDYRSKLGPVR